MIDRDVALVVDDLAGGFTIPDDGRRAQLAESIADRCAEQFDGRELGRADTVCGNIRAMRG